MWHRLKQLIINSTAVWTYKYIGEKLKSLKSDPLNTAAMSVGKKEQDTISKPLNNEQGSYKEKENFDGMPKSCSMNCRSITFYCKYQL